MPSIRRVLSSNKRSPSVLTAAFAFALTVAAIADPGSSSGSEDPDATPAQPPGSDGQRQGRGGDRFAGQPRINALITTNASPTSTIPPTSGKSPGATATARRRW